MNIKLKELQKVTLHLIPGGGEDKTNIGQF